MYAPKIASETEFASSGGSSFTPPPSMELTYLTLLFFLYGYLPSALAFIVSLSISMRTAFSPQGLLSDPR